MSTRDLNSVMDALLRDATVAQLDSQLATLGLDVEQAHAQALGAASLCEEFSARASALALLAGVAIGAELERRRHGRAWRDRPSSSRRAGVC